MAPMTHEEIRTNCVPDGDGFFDDMMSSDVRSLLAEYDAVKESLATAELEKDEITARTLHLAHGLKKNGTKLYVQVAELLESFCAFPVAGEPVIRIVEASREAAERERDEAKHALGERMDGAAVHYGDVIRSLEAKRDALLVALREIQTLAADRHAFMLLGPRAFALAEQIASAAIARATEGSPDAAK